MIELKKASPLVIVLSQVCQARLLQLWKSLHSNMNQLDARYFKGLAGEYTFVLKFRVQKEGEEDYIVRSYSSHFTSRSVNAEITLEPGRYHVLMKITAYRQSDMESAEEVVSRLAPTRREKLVQIGLSHDLAHAKGLAVETRREKEEREEREKRKKVADRQKLREETKKKLQKEWIRARKLEARRQRAEEREVRAEAKQHALQNGSGQVNGTANTVTNGAPVEEPTTNGTVPTIQFNGVQALKSPTRKTRSPRPSLDSLISIDGLSTSDRDLLDGFEFDSDLDMPPEEPEPKPVQHSPSMFSEETNSDPWNAVCVVGLRVYSKDPDVSLQVIRPVPEDDFEAALDRDDPAASATAEKRFWRTGR